MGKNPLKPWGPHRRRTWGPFTTRAHQQIWQTRLHYLDVREGLHGVQNCQLQREPPKSEVHPAYVEGPDLPGPGYGALDCTAELLAKLLSGPEDPDVTALCKAVRAKFGITEPLTKPAMASPSPGLTSLADDLKRSRLSRLLPKITCPSPFHPRARTVPIAELHDVPVTETEKKRANSSGTTC